jgi:glycosyltransferase involved in cell wall biosynthesis
MTVSVVIPTQGRPSVELAIRSAIEQVEVDVEVVVVDASGSGAARQYARDATVYLQSADVLSPGAAREIGSRAASGEWIAFLDDDDLCKPGRLRSEMAAASESGLAHPLVSTDWVSAPYGSIMTWGYEEALRRVDESNGSNGSITRGPHSHPRVGQSLTEYLLRRSGIRRRTNVRTSTLLVDRAFALTVPWNPITRCEDWDWILRAEQSGAQWLHIAEPLTIVSSQSPSSESKKRRTGSRSIDIAWIIPTLFRSHPRELGDFLLSDVAVWFLKDGRVRDGLAAWKLGCILGRPGPAAHARFALFLMRAATRSRHP